MSRNFELLQRAQNLIQRTALSAADKGTEGTQMRSDDATQVFEGVEESAAVEEFAGEMPVDRITLPCSAITDTEKRELLKLTAAAFRLSERARPRVVAVAAVDESASPEKVAACTGELLANQTGEPVCVVDANGEDGRLRGCFSLPGGPGLGEALRGAGSIRRYCTHVCGGLWVLRFGSLGTLGTVAWGNGTKSRMDELRRSFGYVVVVLPPLQPSTEIFGLGQVVDGVMLVLEAHHTKRDAALTAKNMLDNANLPILGAVLSNRTFPIPQAIYDRL